MTDHPALSALTASTAIPMVAANILPPMSFVLPGADGHPLVSISLTDGTIEYGPNYEPDAAARVFWAAMQAMFGSPEAVFGRGLSARVDAALAELRGQLAEVRVLHERYRDVAAVGDQDSCAHCNQIAGHRVPWPCPTVQAIEGAPGAFATGGTIAPRTASGDEVPAILSPCQQTFDEPELTREEALELIAEVGQQAYEAEDRLAFVREMCDAADRDGATITTERVRSWLAYTGCGGAIVLPEDVQEQLKAELDQAPPETEQQFHARRACPGWEYATTEGPRKQWDGADRPPSDDNGDPDPTWERNVDAGRDGWERFDYTEESYWRRRITRADAPAPPH